MRRMRKRGEKVIKTRAEWRRQDQIKKIRIVMTVVLVILCISLAAGGLLAWSQLRQLFSPPHSAPPASRPSSSEVELPVYDDSLSLMLVNAASPVEAGYQPRLTEYGGVKVDERIVPALEKLMQDAKSAGYPLVLTGGYVDSKTQDGLYQGEVERLMNEGHLSRVRAENQAAGTVGKGGNNENQTGLAVAFAAGKGQSTADFAATQQYHWLLENSVYCGFVLRFPEDKENVTGMSFNPSHFRYVGTDNAVRMREFSMCLEEYVAYLGRQSEE